MSIPFAWWLVHGGDAVQADESVSSTVRLAAQRDVREREAPARGTRDTDRSRGGKSPAPRPAPSPDRKVQPRPSADRPNDAGRPDASRSANPSSVDRSRPAAADRPGQRAIEPAVNRPVEPVHRAASPAEVRTTARVVVPARRVPVVTRVPAVTQRTVVLHRSNDHRFARPSPFVVIARPVRPPPRVVWYRPYWTHWWVHPYWRWTHATVVIAALSFDLNPWNDVWVPPTRAGWVWVPGRFGPWGWVPGYWTPTGPAPRAYGVDWVWVPGYWMGTVYVDGFYRRAVRPGWTWVEGYYLSDGSFVRGYWAQEGEPPERGYVWEGGYWDGEYWVEGFWRPESRAGYRWVSAWLDEQGIFHAGYWEPLEDRPGMVWIPGWFTGEKWEEGYWVSEREYENTDAENWKPDEGWDTHAPAGVLPETDEPPPAIPVQM